VIPVQRDLLELKDLQDQLVFQANVETEERLAQLVLKDQKDSQDSQEQLVTQEMQDQLDSLDHVLAHSLKDHETAKNQNHPQKSSDLHHQKRESQKATPSSKFTDTTLARRSMTRRKLWRN